MNSLKERFLYQAMGTHYQPHNRHQKWMPRDAHPTSAGLGIARTDNWHLEVALIF